jgi:hypothetical protein
MDLNPEKVQELIDKTQDHLEIVDQCVFVVGHPDFRDKPIALVANIYFPDGRISYQQLYRLAPHTALQLGQALIDHYGYIESLDNT